MRFGILNFFLTGLYVPNSPGSDDFHFGSKRFYCKLKSDLIVALARAAVADGVGTLSLCDFNNSLCDYRACKRCAEQIILFINRACFKGGENIVAYKFVLKIFDIKL